MISGEDISQWIKEPLKASQAPSNELKELTEKYPYASSLHILYLKNLADKNDLKFESTLKKVASNVMDREQLYQIIKAADVQTTVDEKQEVQHPEELKEVEPIKTILPAEKEVIVEEESTVIKA